MYIFLNTKKTKSFQVLITVLLFLVVISLVVLENVLLFLPKSQRLHNVGWNEVQIVIGLVEELQKFQGLLLHDVRIVALQLQLLLSTFNILLSVRGHAFREEIDYLVCRYSVHLLRHLNVIQFAFEIKK